MPPSRLDRARRTLTDLTARLDDQDRLLDLLLEQAEESAIRIQFVMENFAVKRKSRLAGPTGDQAESVMSLLDWYLQSRESYLAVLKERRDHVEGLREALVAAGETDTRDADPDVDDARPTPDGAASSHNGAVAAPSTDAHAGRVVDLGRARRDVTLN